MRGIRGIILPAVLSLFVATAARANTIIDNFTTTTATITQTGAGTTTSAAVSGPGILGNRVISETVATPLTSANASAGLSPGLATASFNGTYIPVNLANNFTLTETFASQNATAAGLNELSFLIGSSLGTTVLITANGTSTDTFTDPASPPGIAHVISFSSFSDPSVFSNLTSLVFEETFPNTGISGPSVAFSGPILLTTSIPEPSSILMALMGAGIVGTSIVARRRAAKA